MNYEERYNKALERAKKMLASKRSVIVKRQALETIFPELAESEDERMRKELLDYLHTRQVVEGLTDTKVKMDWVTWLEKQGEKSWSEKDEKFVVDTMNFLYRAKKEYAQTSRLEECIAWLKSLKERFGCEANCTTKKNEE